MNAIVLDTETTNTIEDPIAYDIGWAVIDLTTGEVIKMQSFAVAEVFLDKDLMKMAYFFDKVPQYNDEIRQGVRKLKKLNFIRMALMCDCEMFGITQIYAHNARFDYRSCNTTQRYLTSSKYRYFLPFGVEICDTLKMAKEAFNSDENYCEFCRNNNFLTKRGTNRFTAEIIYRFLSKNVDFIEQHKGIDDVLIEKEILLECLRRGSRNGKMW